MELPLFCYPHGLKLRYASQFNAPMPSYYCFVFTDVAGRRNHVACLCFYEQIATDEVLTAYQQLFRDSDDQPPPMQMLEDHALFAPRCICVLSHFPFYRAMTRYLRQLYSISISKTTVPVEKFISAIVSQVRKRTTATFDIIPVLMHVVRLDYRCHSHYLVGGPFKYCWTGD